MRGETYSTTETHAAGDCTSGTRNRFFRGKQMKAEDFAREQQYFVDRRRLVNRAVLGSGVVYGLATPPGKDYGPLVVGAGLAFDRHGREIVLTAPVTLDATNTFVVESSASGCRVRPIDTVSDGSYLLAIHYAERRFGDANLPDECGCDGPERKYVCETSVFSLTSLEGCECPCAEGPCERTCTCEACSPCCASGRGPHACLCQWVTGATVAGDPHALCDWRGFWIDPADGVPLACVTIKVVDGKCAREVVGQIADDCGPRRLVKNNDLLYDLIRGCDLTRIDWISWHDWHRSEAQMPWQTFAGMFHDDGTTDFVVRFSGPVVAATVKRDVVVMSAVTTEQATGWRMARRVPIVGLDLTPDPTQAGYASLPEGTTNQMRFKVRPEWVRDEIERGRESWLSERNFRVEIEIWGDFILDCHEQAVDANAVGLRPTPTGNGTPGGTFLSTFRVEQKGRDKSYDAA